MSAAVSFPLPVVKVCSCGREFTEETWTLLPFVGIHRDEVETLEMRNCSCGSTIAIEIAEDPTSVSFISPPGSK